MPIPNRDRDATEERVNPLALRLSELADEDPDPIEAARALAVLAEHADACLTSAIARAHREGHTLDTIGQRLGVTRQAVWNRLDRADLLAPR